MRTLYCFPPAGGGAGLFRSWAGHLPDGVEVRVVRYAAEPAGAEPAEAGPARAGQAGSVQDLATSAAARVGGDRPVAFFGHSLGALVAFECLRLLQRTGQPRPGIFYAAGHVAPHLPSPGPQLHALASGEFWQEVAALGGTPPEVLANAELRAAVEPRVRVEFRAGETYRFTRGLPLDCDVVALAGEADPQAPAGESAAWRLHTTGGFDLAVVPGGHFFPFLPERGRQETLRVVRSHLDTVITSAA